MSTIAETAVLLALNVRGIVTEKEAVRITTTHGPGSEIVFLVVVATSDRGKVIGKQGRTARSLRILLRAIARENGHDYALNIDEPTRTTDRPMWPQQIACTPTTRGGHGKRARPHV